MSTDRLTLIAFVAIFASACGSPSSPTIAAAPDLRGAWAGVGAVLAWQWTQTYANDGTTTSTACSGSLDITSQNGNSFTGRFAIECPSGRSSGSVRDGQITGTGGLSFRLAPEEGPDPGVPTAWTFASCRLTDPQTYEGSVTSPNTIGVNRVQFMDCPSGRVQVTATFQGTRR